MRAFVNLVGKINLFAGRLLAVLSIVITIIVLWEVLARYLFNAPTTWANEINQYLLCALVMVGGGYTLRKRAHTSVDIVHLHMSDTKRAWVEILSGALVLLFTGPMVYFGVIIAHEAFTSGETSVSAAQIVLWPSQAMVPLGAFLLGLQGLANAMEAVLKLKGALPWPGELP